MSKCGTGLIPAPIVGSCPVVGVTGSSLPEVSPCCIDGELGVFVIYIFLLRRLP